MTFHEKHTLEMHRLNNVAVSVYIRGVIVRTYLYNLSSRGSCMVYFHSRRWISDCCYILKQPSNYIATAVHILLDFSC